jgi:hypothetical protein
LRVSVAWRAELCAAGETIWSMRRRSILLAAGVAVVSEAWKGAAQTSLGTLTWVKAGSLWTRELPDGHAMKVVSSDGLHSPRFSSSGRWLAYRNRHDKPSVVQSDGQSGASLEGEDAVWFPRDDRLVVTRDGDVSVFAPEDGWKSPGMVLKGVGIPVFGPDGERFVFVRHIGRVADKDGAPSAAQLCLASVAAPKAQTGGARFEQWQSSTLWLDARWQIHSLLVRPRLVRVDLE